VKGQLNHLIRLQEIDNQLSQSTARKSNQPLQILEARRPLETAQERLNQARAVLESASKTRRDKERDLQSQEEHITKLKSRQTDIKTNKEYQALLQELETAKQAKGQLEEELLLLMEEMDKESVNLRQYEQTFKQAEEVFRSKEQALADEAQELDGTIRKLESDRATAVEQLDRKIRTNYERLKREGKGLAIVPIIGGTCGGCHMNIPPQLVAEVKVETEMHSCSYCHRILFWETPSSPSGDPDAVKSMSS
jgi:uncharacterized protein